MRLRPELLVPVVLVAVFGGGGWYVEKQRARQRSALSGFFESQPTQVASRTAGQLLVVKVNTDEVAGVGDRLGIRSIPTMAVFKSGREVARTSGARPAKDIEAFVANALR